MEEKKKVGAGLGVILEKDGKITRLLEGSFEISESII